MVSFLRHVAFTLAVLCLAPQVTKTYAQETPPIDVTLVSSVSATGAQGTLLLGVKFTVPAPWKIYAPGPQEVTDPLNRHPQFAWKISPLMPPPLITWPQPQMFTEPMGTSYGYDRDVILPLTLDPTTPGLPVTISGEVTFLACAALCVPVTQKLALSLPAGPAHPTLEAPEILRYRTGEIDMTSPVQDTRAHLWLMMVFAFLGGLILNVMPCVLPVLSLKLRHFLTLAPERTPYRKSLGFSFLGIMVSFWVLAVGAMILKAGGQAVGWGLHFQSPLFLLLMALLLLIFAKGLWNEDGFSLPPSVQQVLSKILGTHHARHPLFYEHFFSGVFATLLATPCTAPFLGTALGYALGQGPWEMGLLFSLMGVGFGLPYIVLFFVPPQKLPLPKPGPWMETVSRVFSVGMALTGVWLLWVFSHHVGPFKAALVVGMLLMGLIALFGARLWQGFPLLGKGLLLGAIGITLFWTNPRGDAAAPETFWQTFEEGKIAPALAQGKVVFVDVTASWCATCQVNKLLVLRAQKIQEILSGPNVLALRADWTLPSETITRYLARFHRAGIPFNIVYGPRAPQGLVLPELLRAQDVTTALEQAG